MKKIFKKSLALVLSAALCLTALVGCLTVSAEETAATPTYTIGTAEGKVGDTVTVTATLTNLTEVCAQHIKVTFPSVLEVGAITDGDGNAYTQLTGGSTDVTGEDVIALYSKTTTAAGDTLIQFVDFVNWPDTDAVASMTIKFAVTVKDTAVVGTTYDITAAVDAADYDATELLKVDIANGSVTVKAATTEPVLDSNLQFLPRATSVQDTLGVGYTLRKTTVKDYSSFEIVATATKYNTSRNKFIADPQVLKITETTSFYTATCSGIAMFELDLPISAYIKCYDAEGNYVAYSETVTDVPADLLKTRYANSTSQVFKTMVTDMLNLGAAAQSYFGSQSNAVGSDLSKATLINDGWDQEFATPGDLTDLTILDELKWDENSPLTEADITIRTSLNHAETPTLGYLIRDVKKSLNSEDLTLEVSYDAQYPKAFAGTRSDTVTGSKFVTAGSFFTYAFSGMTLADSDRTITATLYYKGEKVLTYSSTMETAINAKLTGSETSVALSVALGKFEASTRAYFAAN